MNYNEAINYIESTYKYGSVLGLENIKELMKRLNNPQDKLKFIHVAGTNGKGSVCAFLTSIIANAGFKVGRYISPVIFEYREKIQTVFIDKNACLQNEYISEAAVGRIIGQIKNIIDDMLKDGFSHPTSYEIETALMFLYLLEQNCDYIVLETGLGGRLDATNIVTTTICSVITSISLDHMQVLGDTVEKIAYEKIGIAKPKSHVVSYPQKKSVIEVLKNYCLEIGAIFYETSFDFLSDISYNLKETTFSYKGYKDIKIKLLGENQIKNAVLAIEAAEVLIKCGIKISNENIYNGLFNTVWHGRFEIVYNNPTMIIDGAHNLDGAISLTKNIELYFNNKKIIYIIGIFADKDYKGILKQTMNFAHTVIVIQPNNPRALLKDTLSKEVQIYNNNIFIEDNVINAVKKAISICNKEDIIIAFGSLSYIGEIYKFFMGDKN